MLWSTVDIPCKSGIRFSALSWNNLELKINNKPRITRYLGGCVATVLPQNGIKHPKHASCFNLLLVILTEYNKV